MRFKWEPIALLVFVVLLGVWLVWSNRTQIYGIHPREGAHVNEVRIGNSRGVLEVWRSTPDADPVFRFLMRDGFATPELTADEFRARFGDRIYYDATRPSPNHLFRLFNITSLSSMAWVLLGLGGQAAFSGRMLLQWVLSEKQGKSVVPPVFWWLSLCGGAAMFAYFVWRQDLIGVMGQSAGVVVYARNLRLIYKQRRRLASAQAASGGLPTSPAPPAM